MSKNIVERMARAAYHATRRNRPWERLSAFNRAKALTEMTAALTTLKEPTEFMLASAHRNNHPRDIETWQTMIDAGLEQARKEG